MSTQDDLPMDAACELSVVIKALNEEVNIERTLRCALAAIEGRHAEVILADSLSSDHTVEIARTLPVRIVQLTNPGDRSCGVGAQLGYQYSRGRYVLVMDGDMDLQKSFVDAAIICLEEDPGLAGVGGKIVDVHLENIEYRARQARAPRDAMTGPVDRLNGGGLFRREAIESVGYMTNRNLHACEELEQALRLRSKGWRFERLPLVSVFHYGHTASTWALMRRRWTSRYVCGPGELLRSALGKPYFWEAARTQFHLFVVLSWWAALLILFASLLANQYWQIGVAWLVLALFPAALMSWRRRNVSLGAYSVAAWCVDAGGLLRGLVQPKCDPRTPIAASELRVYIELGLTQSINNSKNKNLPFR